MALSILLCYVFSFLFPLRLYRSFGYNFVTSYRVSLEVSLLSDVHCIKTSVVSNVCKSMCVIKHD